MRCDHPQCTGNHDRNKWENICLRTKEAGLARERKRYDALSWRELHVEQLRVRRLKAAQRIARRARGAVPLQGRD